MILNQLNLARKYYRDGGMPLILHTLSQKKKFPKFLIHYQAVDIYYYPNPEDIRPPKRSPSFQITQAEATDCHELVSLAWTNPSDAIYDRMNKILRSQIVYKATKNNKIIGFLEVYKNEYSIPFTFGCAYFSLDKNQIFLGYGFVQETYRMKGVFPHLLSHISQIFSHNSEFYTYIDIHNTPSILATKRAGFKHFSHLSKLTLIKKLSYWSCKKKLLGTDCSTGSRIAFFSLKSHDLHITPPQ